MAVTKSTIACVSGSLAGPDCRRTASRPATERRPVVREVAVEVDEVGVGAPVGRLPVRVHRLDRARGRHRRARAAVASSLDDRHAGVLVAVDHADHEHDGAARRPSLDGGDRPTLDRTADLEHLEGVRGQAGEPGGVVVVVVGGGRRRWRRRRGRCVATSVVVVVVETRRHRRWRRGARSWRRRRSGSSSPTRRHRTPPRLRDTSRRCMRPERTRSGRRLGRSGRPRRRRPRARRCGCGPARRPW